MKGRMEDRLLYGHYTLNQTGNWTGYKIDADGDGYDDNDGDLTQAREHNAANEIYHAA